MEEISTPVPAHPPASEQQDDALTVFPQNGVYGSGHMPTATQHSLLDITVAWFRHMIRGKQDTIKEAIEEVLEEHSDETEGLDPQEKAMLHNILNFSDITAEDIMTPRMEIHAVEENTSLEDLKRLIADQQHTRIPVYSDILDNIVGFLHVKDLIAVLCGDQHFDLKAMMRPMLFIPPSMKVTDLLLQMRQSCSHMAVIIDEYGGTDGLVTLENIFEEIVGDIQDEHDDEPDEPEWKQLSVNEFEADARVRIKKLEQELSVDFDEDEDEDYNTLGGLVFAEAGRVPSVGETIDHANGISFKILDADPRRIKKVRITIPEAELAE